MPGGDGTGPMGIGPGGGWGPCGQGRGRLAWTGPGRLGAHLGFGGRGWRHRVWSGGWARFRAGFWKDDLPPRIDERQLLEREAEALEAELADIRRRLEHLGRPTADGE